MPQYTGPLVLGAGSRLIIDGQALPEAWTEDFSTSKLGGRWIGSSICVRKTWHDIGVTGDNWGIASTTRDVIRLTTPSGKAWERFAIIVTSAHIWANVGGTGIYDIGCGTSVASPVSRNVINRSGVATGVETRTYSKFDFDPSFERGRLIDNTTDTTFRLYWNGSSLGSGPTGSVSIAIFGVIVPDPSTSDS